NTDQPSVIIDEAFAVAKLLYDQLIPLHSLATEEATHTQREICNVCERWWHGNFDGKGQLITSLVSLLLVYSLNDDSDVNDVKRLYLIRSAINFFDFEDESIENFKSRLLKTVGSLLFLQTDVGKKFIQHLFTVDGDFADELHDALKAQLVNGEGSARSACAEIYVAIWKSAFGDSSEALHKALKAQLNAAGASARTACADVYYRTWKSASRFSSDEDVDGEEDEVSSRQSNAGALDSGGDSPAPESAHALAAGPPAAGAAGRLADIVSGNPDFGFTSTGHEFVVRCTRSGNAHQGLGFSLRRCLFLGRVVYMVNNIYESGTALRVRKSDIFVSAGNLTASDLISRHVHASKREAVLRETLANLPMPVDLKFLRISVPRGSLRLVKDAHIADGVAPNPRNNQFQTFDVRYDNSEKHIGFRLKRKKVHGIDVFVAVRIDQSDEQMSMLLENDVLVMVNGKRLILQVGPIVSPDERGAALTSIIDIMPSPKTLTFKRYPENAVFSDPPAPAQQSEGGRRVDYSHPIAIGKVKLLHDEGTEPSNDVAYIKRHSVFVICCYTDGTAKVQYVFPSTRLNRIVPINELDDLTEPLGVPAELDGQNNRIVGSDIPSFDEDSRAMKSKKRKAAADEREDALGFAPKKHRWKLSNSTYVTAGRRSKFRLALSELSPQAQQDYDDFDIRSSEGDHLDPPSGDTDLGFIRESELQLVQPSNQQQANPQGQPMSHVRIVKGKLRINGIEYVSRNDKRCRCKRDKPGRKRRCPGMAQVIQGQCRITIDHTNECTLASLTEGGVINTLDRKVATDLELLYSDKSYFIENQNIIQVWTRIDARKQFPNLDEQTKLIDLIVESDWERARAIVDDIKNMNGKVVEPYYYTSSFGLVASVINAMITYIGHITNGEYISLKLTATKDGEKTRVYCNAAHVVFDVYGSGPRQNGEGGTIDHSLTGRRQHNVPNRLQRIHVQHNCAGGCARGLGRESRRNVSQG
ncbi:hypothetical protein THAOC_34305, partial [Thalassiosira oceanica]